MMKREEGGIKKMHSARPLRLLIVSLCFAALVSFAARAQQTSAALGFKQALQLAQESSKVQLAQLKLEQAQRRFTSAGSPVSAALSSGYSYSTVGGSGVNPLSLSASFNIIPYGPTAERKQQARWAVQQAQLDASAARATALSKVAQDYLSALRAGQNEALQEGAVKLAQQSLNVTKAEQQAGAATSADVLQAQIALQAAQNDLATATRTQQQALATLSLDLGREVTAVSGEPGASTTPPDADLSGAALDARLEQRSDVFSARVAASEARQSTADTLRNSLPSATLSTEYSSAANGAQFKAGASLGTGGGSAFQPTVSVSYDPNYQSSSPGTTGSQQNFAVGISLSVPLDPSLPATLEASKLAVQSSQLAATSALAQARLEVQTDRNALAAAQASAAQSQALLKQSQQSVSDAQTQYKLGLLTQLDVQQALQAAAEAKLNAAKAQDQVLLARMALAQALALDPLEVFGESP
jgi:outer membrane protein TolC